MKRLSLILALLLWATTASADWSITIQGPVTISGPGAAPVVISAPPIKPPIDPPPPPPPPPPPRDLTPFVFPGFCPGQNESGDSITNRAVFLFQLVPGSGANTTFYASLDGDPNPSVSTHVCAGIIKPGATVAGTGRAVGERRLWVPFRVDGRPIATTYPDQIRCALATGRACP